MIDELKETVPDLKIREELLVTAPDPSGLQHDEIVSTKQMWPAFVPTWLRNKLTWASEVRKVHPDAALHPSVIKRFSSETVPSVEDVKPYRPENLREHSKVRQFFD